LVWVVGPGRLIAGVLRFFKRTIACFRKRKSEVNEKFSKEASGCRQVLANGTWALLVVAAFLFPQSSWLWIAYTGAMAAVNADTWATELGVLSKRAPRLISSGRRVERGTSGGVSLAGYLAALAGAALIGLTAALFSPSLPFLIVVIVSVLGGLAGSTLDSLQTTLQAIYWCRSAKKRQNAIQSMRNGDVQAAGLPWLNNDLVNFAPWLGQPGIFAGWLFLSKSGENRQESGYWRS
jgi:uncharacterized protein (TIGR00297 family)